MAQGLAIIVMINWLRSGNMLMASFGLETLGNSERFFPGIAAFLRKSGYNLADLEYSVVTD